MAVPVLAGAAVQNGKPMAWRYRALLAAADVFYQRAPAYAPGASLRFRLPKLDPAAADGLRVTLSNAAGGRDLVLGTDLSFVLPRDASAVSADSEVVVNRHFAAGDYLLPNVEIRSPGLADNLYRLGDLRLACLAQNAMARADPALTGWVKWAVIFDTKGCDAVTLAHVAPSGVVYESVTLRIGGRETVLRIDAAPLLNDPAWPNDTTIQYKPVAGR